MIQGNNADNNRNCENDNLKEYQSLNRPKKFNFGLIIGIIVAVLVIISIVIIFYKNSDAESLNLANNFKENSVSKEEIEKYGIEKETTWINLPLGVTYDIPKSINSSMVNGAYALPYMHGNSFNYYYNYNIYVETSLEGSNNLETLALDITNEKISDKYKNAYKFGKELNTFKIEKTEKIKISDIEAVYFESNELEVESLFGDPLKYKYLGYSFKYNEQYISVYGELLLEEDDKKEILKQMLQYVIASINKYNNQTFEELDSNLEELFDEGFVNSDKTFTLNYISDHVINGILGNDAYTHGCVEIELDYINWDGNLDTIFDATRDIKINEEKKYPYYIFDEFKWVLTSKNEDTGLYEDRKACEIKSEAYVNINNIEMKKYIIKSSWRESGKTTGYIVVYTFIIDNKPYVFQYCLNMSMDDFANISEEENIIIKQTEVVADTCIRSIRFLKDGEDWMDYIGS